jgi:hypothetical protein
LLWIQRCRVITGPGAVVVFLETVSNWFGILR